MIMMIVGISIVSLVIRIDIVMMLTITMMLC